MRRLPYPDPGVPDLRSPLRFLRWVAKGQRRTLLGGVFFGIIWMVSQALFPAAVGQAIDLGIIAGDQRQLLVWGGVLVALGATAALSGAMRHRFAVENWLRSSFRCVQLIGYKAADTGEALPRRMPTGEVVATVASDSMRLGGLYDVSARFAGAIVSYVVVAVILLSKSRPLGLVVLIGVPVLVSSLSLILRPLQKRQAEQREQSGRLTTLGADTVAGLRVLRGIGGEQQFLRRYQEQSQRVRLAGVRVAGVQAGLDAAQVLLPGVFVVLVTWLGAGFALDGTITPGDLVQFYGYAAFLVMPLRTATEFADRATRAHIAARKIIRVLSTEPDTSDTTDPDSRGSDNRNADPAEPAEGVPLTDPVSNVTIVAGRLTAIVSARPEESSALADRLGRFGRTRSEAHLDGVAIADLPLATVRRRIVVSEIDPRLFTGSLRGALDPHGIHDDATILTALTVASGEDVLEALPCGLDSEVEERGRSFSGGQRQRLTLTRALLTSAETLVLIEPTSAVDTHTEARIAVRLAGARTGRTTVLMTASPLMLDQADVVILLVDGVSTAAGTHKELMATSPAYRKHGLPGRGNLMSLTAEPAARTLPIADMASVRRHARGLLQEHRWTMTTVIGLHALAALASLVAPRLVGSLVDGITHGTTQAQINTQISWLAGSVLLQTVLMWAARRSSFIMGETVFAQLREQFIARVSALPLSTVERAGTGDLVSRTTNDVEALSQVVRFGIPSLFVAVVTTVLTVAAAVVAGPLVAAPIMIGVPIMWCSTRWYLKRAPAGYLRERATYAVANGVITETVDGARTVDALGLRSKRRQRTDDAIAGCFDAEIYTLRLRLIWFPQVELAYLLPVAATLVWGGWLVAGGHATVGTVTAVVLYVQQMAGPLDDLLSWLDEIQVGATSLARVIGIDDVPADRSATGESPHGRDIAVDDVRYSYRPGHDVLKGVSLDLRPGERLAIVGPSGAGKSTLGRLLAGIDGPGSGRVEVGGVRLVDLELETLRGEVALVSQEHHVFVGTVADNLLLARPAATSDDLWSALRAVDAQGWASGLPQGLSTMVGSGSQALTEAQSQQLALARLVLADPHTLVLDEATSLLDPRAARHLERSLAAVVRGRTVVAIAHRLHTAHDADRVAVVEDGNITEIGTHDELVAANGAYAALWRSWA